MVDKLPTISTQLKIIAAVKATRQGGDGEIKKIKNMMMMMMMRMMMSMMMMMMMMMFNDDDDDV